MMLNDDTVFKEALKENNLEKLKKVPKSDLHNHSLFGMRFKDFDKIAGKFPEPPSNIDSLKNLNQYIFNELLPLIENSSIYENLITATLEEAVSDGVKILQTSFDINSVRFFKSLNNLLYTIKRLKEKFQDKINFEPEIGIQKDIDEDRLENCLIPLIDSSVFYSIDLYGDESVTDFNRFKKYYIYAKKKGLTLKVHIGEFSPSEIVKKAVEILNPDVIQHGITIATDDYMIDMVKEREIQLNICPTSNVVLCAVKDYKSHPIKRLFHKGVKVTVNTDDLLIFDSSVSEEFLKLYKNNVLDADELNEIRKIGLNNFSGELNE